MGFLERATWKENGCWNMHRMCILQQPSGKASIYAGFRDVKCASPKCVVTQFAQTLAACISRRNMLPERQQKKRCPWQDRLLPSPAHKHPSHPFFTSGTIRMDRNPDMGYNNPSHIFLQKSYNIFRNPHSAVNSPEGWLCHTVLSKHPEGLFPPLWIL